MWIIYYCDPSTKSWRISKFSSKQDAEDLCDWLENRSCEFRVRLGESAPSGVGSGQEKEAAESADHPGRTHVEVGEVQTGHVELPAVRKRAMSR